MKKYFLLGILFFLIGLGGIFLLTHNTSKQEENHYVESSTTTVIENNNLGPITNSSTQSRNKKQTSQEIDTSTIAANDFWERVYMDNRIKGSFADFIISIYEKQNTTDDFVTWYAKNPDDDDVDLGNLNNQTLSTPEWYNKFDSFQQEHQSSETFNTWIDRIYELQGSQQDFESWYRDNPAPYEGVKYD
ncbi:hypothetical protein P7D85_14265 [Enterococcus hulanensis]|uniref:DUF5067 domain-containing protein n=1 Tax=Enterococcus hulanensis TaxID=2559929 RepID=A0ABU3F211_9ENTE|nr:hypothetical protein [Enterococcus hulanensis]MDT2600947.1 hypothetical protein [Enterococcus hulanensis]MDT2611535.1 hypothetical protein [Enterococcus hulanensis]MDT2617980.1 hypothetical protein [Enterococcus hulanensis]MDT2628983.1 hypothetical protein [Enterococcus hulanensis]MDT2656545.1 hypothetical protein [Enterococcus hulanensis]